MTVGCAGEGAARADGAGGDAAQDADTYGEMCLATQVLEEQCALPAAAMDDKLRGMHAQLADARDVLANAAPSAAAARFMAMVVSNVVEQFHALVDGAACGAAPGASTPMPRAGSGAGSADREASHDGAGAVQLAVAVK
jgi:hypothetical protein